MKGKIPEGPGVKQGKLATMPDSPNAVSSQTDIEDKKVEPLALKEDLFATKKAILDALHEMGSNEVIVSEGNYTYSVFTSFIFRFKDDVELYIDESSRLLHFRSASRTGYSDLGVNRKRYEKFKKIYSAL